MQAEQSNSDTSGERYHILSLDGGGTWAVLEAMTLADLYGWDTRGHEILRHFDLVVANSGGSLVAASLWADMTPRQLIGEFGKEDILQKVFVRLSLLRGFPRSVFPSFKLGPKYRTDKKKEGIAGVIEKYKPGLANEPIQTLQREFGRAGGRTTDLLLLAYDYNTNRARFLRTNPGTKAGSQVEQAKRANDMRAAGRAPDVLKYRTTLAEAVHASTNAPVNYFDAPAEISYSTEPLWAWDGAIAGYNNPMLAGITEALANGANRRAIQILSLGTGNVVLPMRGGEFQAAHDWLLASRYDPGWWILGDLRKLSTSILENPPDVATYVAYFMIDDQRNLDGVPDDSELRRNTRIVRLNPLLQPIVYPGTTLFDVPGAHSNHPDKLTPDEFKFMLGMDIDAVTKEEVDLIQRFGRLWLDDWVHNQPILAGPTRVECEIGQRWYSQGRTRARELGIVPMPPPARRTEEEAQVRAKDVLEGSIREEMELRRDGQSPADGVRGGPGAARPGRAA
jgi:hypothetical protein